MADDQDQREVARILVLVDEWRPLRGRLTTEAAGESAATEFRGWSGLAAALTAIEESASGSLG